MATANSQVKQMPVDPNANYGSPIRKDGGNSKMQYGNDLRSGQGKDNFPKGK